MFGKTIAFRLLSGFLAIILISLVLPFLYCSYLTEEAELDVLKTKAAEEMSLLREMIPEHPHVTDGARLAAFLTQAAESLHVGLAYYVDDRLYARSAGGPINFESLSLADVPAADQGFPRFNIRTLKPAGKRILSASMAIHETVSIPNGRLVYAVVFPTHDRENIFFFVFVGLICLGLGIGLLMTRFFSQAYEQTCKTFSEAHQSILRGDYDHRIRIFPISGFGAHADSFNTMAQSIAKKISGLESRKEQLEAVFNGMSEGVLVLDHRGRIESWNRTMYLLSEEIAKHAGRKPLEAFMDLDLQQAVDEIYTGSGSYENYLIRLKVADEREIEVTLEPFLDTTNKFKTVMVFRDITEMRRLEQIRRDFVANVSHELKTPITSIKGYTETLVENGSIPEETKHNFLRIILKNADHMAKMVNDLMSLARVEHNGERIAPEAVDAATVLAHSIETVSPLATERDVIIVNDISSRTMVTAEPERLSEVFINLLDNAVKYSPEGGTVAVSAEPEGERVTFRIADQGPGIPDAFKERIFERFYRIGSHTKDKIGSSGLGLAICRNIIRNFGGRIRVENVPGAPDKTGAVFVFSLNKAQSQDIEEPSQDSE